MPEFSEETMSSIWAHGANAVVALVILIVGWIVAGFVGGLVSKSCNKAKIDVTLGKFFAKATRWLILIMVLLAVLGRFGVETTSFAAVLAAAGFAVGMAMQGTLGNFSAGVMLLIFRPFKVGDVVSVAGHTGKVNEIELFTTTLDTPDNRRMILPNGAIFGASIENVTFHPKRRVDVAVGVEYAADIDKTRAVLQAAASGVEGRLKEEDPVVVLTGLGASSVDWAVRVWSNTADFFAVKEALTETIKKSLDEAGIGIPFPQMDVHVDGSLSGISG